MFVFLKRLWICFSRYEVGKSHLHQRGFVLNQMNKQPFRTTTGSKPVTHLFINTPFISAWSGSGVLCVTRLLWSFKRETHTERWIFCGQRWIRSSSGFVLQEGTEVWKGAFIWIRDGHAEPCWLGVSFKIKVPLSNATLCSTCIHVFHQNGLRMCSFPLIWKAS